jgi:hypothetical protein
VRKDSGDNDSLKTAASSNSSGIGSDEEIEVKNTSPIKKDQEIKNEDRIYQEERIAEK